MPVLDLLQEDGSLHPFATVSLLSVQFFPAPEEESKRRDYAAVAAAQRAVQLAVAEGRPSIELPTSWAELLVQSPPARKVLAAADSKAKSAWMAGELILFLVNAAIHHPELEVNISKALWALEQIFRGQKTRGGKVLSVGERTIWNAWTHFKPAAHLWAVHQIWTQERPHDRTTAKSFVNLMCDRFLEYLAYSEVIRKAAVERRIIQHSEIWRPPETLKLPSVRIDFPGLPQPAIEELAKYRPKHERG